MEAEKVFRRQEVQKEKLQIIYHSLSSNSGRIYYRRNRMGDQGR